MKFVLRFFFDAGSGICLWSGNDAARERFDYPVELDDLPLSEETREAAAALLARYDAQFNWDDPASDGADDPQFNAAARAVLERIRAELGPEFEVRDELE